MYRYRVEHGRIGIMQKIKYADCECICKIPYKTNSEQIKITKDGKTYYIIKHK